MRIAAAAVCAAAASLVAAPAASPHSGHGIIDVSVAEFKYAPADVTIIQGDTVLWSWNGPDVNHTVTSDEGEAISFDSDSGKSAGQVSHSRGDAFPFTFNTAGTFRYHCKVHPSFMRGTVSVTPAPPTPPPAASAPPVLSKVSVKPKRFCSRCSKPGLTARFTVDMPTTIRALIRRRGKTVKEIDFNAPPGPSAKKLKFRKLRNGKYVLRLLAVDDTTGKTSKPVDRNVEVRG